MRKTDKAVRYHVVEAYAASKETYTKDNMFVVEVIFCEMWYGRNMRHTEICKIHTYFIYKGTCVQPVTSLLTVTAMSTTKRLKNKIEGPIWFSSQTYCSLMTCLSPFGKIDF